jgi:hypothetical protein
MNEMSVYEIAHALRDIQDAHRALDARIVALREKVENINTNSVDHADRRSRLEEHMAKWGRRPLITLEDK